MINIKNKENCTGCTVCANICPKNAITMVADKEGFIYPNVNHTKCINCDLCSNKCPKLNYISTPPNYEKAFVAYCKNDKIRKKSSSGGLFSLFAEYIFSKHGVVIGAAYDENFNVHHIVIENIEDLSDIVGSKYVQSDLESIYKNVKTALYEGRYVLFAGTNCQIEGLLSYLGNTPSELLFCIDIICLGVPSAKVWDYYKKSFIPQKPIKSINFKDKSFGWNRFHIHFTFFDNKEYYVRGVYSEYMQTYFRKYNMRPSCYSCQFKTKNRKSDVTLADCWGINDFASDLNDNKGCSSVIIHSEKGVGLFNEIKEKLIFREAIANEVIKGNPNYLTSAQKPYLRKIFWKVFDFSPKLALIIFGNSLLLQVKDKIKWLIGR